MSTIGHCHRCVLAAGARCRGACPCPISGVEITVHRDAAFCPHPDGARFGIAARPDDWEELSRAVPAGAATEPVDSVAMQPMAPPDSAKWGPEKWRKLHRFCLTPDARDAEKLAAFVAAFRQEVPCGTCRSHLVEFEKRSPPDPADPFGWSVGLHNHVNARLAKPLLSVEEAGAIHRGGEGAGDDRSRTEAASIDN